MNDYIKIKEKYIEDVFGIVSLYEHKKTKAHIVVIKNDDNNKVFNISFKTIPHDDSGVAHILEHSVLCGSKKYNVKDPFVELLKSSLNTFLNAITYSDKTCYPCASLNESDFKNLISVYLDAVFYPNIYKNEEIFLQEGIRIDENFNFNGVVFNEMKGAYSSPEQILMYNIMKNIFPNTIYKYESGGYPLNICDLTYKDFLEYHKKYYHPSNSYIYLYGNMDEEEILNYISNNYLNNFKYQEYVEEIEYEKAFLKPKKIMNTYYLSGNDLNNKTFLSYNIALNNNKDIKGLIALNLILNYLFSSNGPLLKKIIDEEICYDVAITFTDNIKQPLINIIGINGDLKNEDLSAFFGSSLASLKIVATYSLAYNAKLLCKAGVGVMISLKDLVSVEDSDLAFVPLSPAIGAESSFVWGRGRILSPSAAAFLESVKLAWSTHQDHQ